MSRKCALYQLWWGMLFCFSPPNLPEPTHGGGIGTGLPRTTARHKVEGYGDSHHAERLRDSPYLGLAHGRSR